MSRDDACRQTEPSPPAGDDPTLPAGPAVSMPSVRFPWPFLVLAGVGLLGVWLFTGSRFSLRLRATPHVGMIGSALAVGLIAVGLDALALKALVRLASGRIRFVAAVRIVLIYAFFSAVTPTSLGGEVSMTWLLARRRLSTGAAATITGIRSLLRILILLLALPVIVLAKPPGLGGFLSVAVLAAGCVSMAVLGAVVLLMVRQRLRGNRGSAGPAATWLTATGSGVVGRVLRVLDTLASECWEIITLGVCRKPGLLAAAALLTLGQLFAYSAIVPLSAFALGLSVPFWKCVIGAALVQMTMLFAPLPGAGGVAEAGMGVVLKDLAGPEMVLQTVFLWRFLSTYLRVFVGAGLTLWPRRRRSSA